MIWYIQAMVHNFAYVNICTDFSKHSCLYWCKDLVNSVNNWFLLDIFLLIQESLISHFYQGDNDHNYEDNWTTLWLKTICRFINSYRHKSRVKWKLQKYKSNNFFNWLNFKITWQFVLEINILSFQWTV